MRYQKRQWLETVIPGLVVAILLVLWGPTLFESFIRSIAELGEEVRSGQQRMAPGPLRIPRLEETPTEVPVQAPAKKEARLQELVPGSGSGGNQTVLWVVAFFLALAAFRQAWRLRR